MTQTILITGPGLAPAAADVLTGAGYRPVYVPPYTTGDGLIDIVRATDPVGILARMGHVDEAVFAAAPRLRVVSKHGAGVDNIDTDAAARRGIPVLNAAGANAVSVAEQTIALMFAVAKKVIPLDNGLRNGRWDKPGFQGRELAGSVLGLVAFGAIAQQTARFAKGLGLTVKAFDPYAPADVFAAEGVEQVSDLDMLFAGCDVLSLHCPLTASTRNLVDAERLSRMKPDAIIINTARGGLIDETALADALREGRIFGAGLDTFAQEPPAADHPFWSEPRLVLSPHIGGVTTAANHRVGVEAAQGIVDVLAGRAVSPSRIVNRDRLSISA